MRPAAEHGQLLAPRTTIELHSSKSAKEGQRPSIATHPQEQPCGRKRNWAEAVENGIKCKCFPRKSDLLVPNAKAHLSFPAEKMFLSQQFVDLDPTSTYVHQPPHIVGF